MAKSFSFVLDLMEDIFSINNEKTGDKDTTDDTDTSDDDDNTIVQAGIPKNIAPIPRPSREEVITAHRTRMTT